MNMKSALFCLLIFAFCNKAQLQLNCAAVSCLANACRETNCPAFPNAVCYTDECGCNPQFYVNNRLVDCGRRQPQLPQQQQCQNPVNCWADPCQVNSCRAYPEATCVANYCGGCHANFYVNGRQVDCDGPRPTNSGNCPYNWLGVMVQCTQKGPDQCNNCERQGQLCCPHGCGQMCKEPSDVPTTPRIPVRQGVCPFDDIGSRVRCAGPLLDRCDNCESRGQLCCTNGCAKICKDPVAPSTPATPVSTGECPVEEVRVMCFVFGPDECNNCGARGQLCCGHGCGQKCKDPVRRQPQPTPVQGQCPYDDLAPRVRCSGPQIDQCYGQCERQGKLCCSNGCSKICKDPVRWQEPTPVQGECPYDDLLPRVLCQGPQVDRCYGQCEQQGKLCCSNGCNKICKHPIIIDPPMPLTTARPPGPVLGQCPVDYLAMVVSCVRPIQDQCFGQCESKGQLCCPHGCNKICKVPENNQPVKQCPPMRPGMAGICVEMCDNCEARGQMCCSNGCGHQCMTPITVGATTTPARVIPTGPQCPAVQPGMMGHCAEMCNNCEARGQLCCSNGCGHVCKDPVYYRG